MAGWWWRIHHSVAELLPLRCLTPDYGRSSSVVEISATTPARRSRMSHSQTSKTRQSASSSWLALARVALAVELELAGPELRVRLGQVRVAARAVVPVAAVHEDGHAATRVRDVRPSWRALPVQPIAGMAGLTKRCTKLPFGLRVAGSVRLHDRAHGRRRRRRIGQLQAGHCAKYGRAVATGSAARSPESHTRVMRMRVESHRYAEDVLEARFRDEWDEIREVLGTLEVPLRPAGPVHARRTTEDAEAADAHVRRPPCQRPPAHRPVGHERADR